MSELFQYLETRGRTLVVGDLHGCYDRLQQALTDIGFAPAKESLLSVGDLTDRGPRSLDCLRLLNEPWFHAVRGNHEALMLAALCDGDAESRALWELNGGHWFWQLDKAQQTEVRALCQDKVMNLPVAMEIRTPGGYHIGLVHADPLVDNWRELRARLRYPRPDADFVEQLQWSRQRLMSLHRDPAAADATERARCHIAGIDLVCMGHTPLPEARPLGRGNLLWLDTGAFAGHPLGLLDVEAYLAQLGQPPTGALPPQ